MLGRCGSKHYCRDSLEYCIKNNGCLTEDPIILFLGGVNGTSLDKALLSYCHLLETYQCIEFQIFGRFQDKPAQALYQRAGYTVYKQDNPFVVLLGQDRRYLMHKRLTPGLTPGSA